MSLPNNDHNRALSYLEEFKFEIQQKYKHRFGERKSSNEIVTLSESILNLASHAALPVLLNAEFVHLLRINFFNGAFENKTGNKDLLSYIDEQDILLSDLCSELGSGLYKIIPEVRTVLLERLLTEYGLDRLKGVAALLWKYTATKTVWGENKRLENAQRLTALNFLDPNKAKEWCDTASERIGSMSEEEDWAVAMIAELETLGSYTRPEKPLREMKVFLVGDGGAGKTSLSKLLRNETFDSQEAITPGISIIDWIYEDLKIHLWDFGGQEIMHATHQFFLSKHSLYILVLDGRKEEDAEYWLKYIQSFGGNSPVLVVLNKIDQHPSFDINRKYFLDKYPNIIGFYKLSCSTKDGLNEFKQALINAFEKSDALQTIWNENWFKVKTALENEHQQYISSEYYRELCCKYEINDTQSQDTLAQLLNDLGIIVYFADLRLNDTFVLEPRWITEAVYKILNSKQLAEKHGLLYLNDLSEILAPQATKDYDYPIDKHRHIIELMKKFELCYQVDESHILIPDLLDIQEPEYIFNDKQPLRFRLQYEFLPKSIFFRFIVKRHHEIKDSLCWRNGVVLYGKNTESTAIIRADNRERLIDIQIEGEQKRDYFAVIRNTLNEIHNSFEKLEVTELVPLPDNPELCVEYRELIGYEMSGTDKYFVGKLSKYYSVSKLLNGIEKPEQKNNFQGISFNKIRILILVANPFNMAALTLDEEYQRIHSLWRRCALRDQFDVHACFDTRAETLQSEVLQFKPHLIHFSGHGTKDSVIFANSSGYQTHEVSKSALANLFKLCAPHLKAVFLNACYSAINAEDIAGQVDYFIGMNDAIDDKAGTVFSQGFYTAIFNQNTLDIEQAFSAALNQMAIAHISESEQRKPILQKRCQTYVQGYKYDVFISFADEDAQWTSDFANYLCKQLRVKLTTFDGFHFYTGNDFSQLTQSAILLIIASPAYCQQYQSQFEQLGIQTEQKPTFLIETDAYIIPDSLKGLSRYKFWYDDDQQGIIFLQDEAYIEKIYEVAELVAKSLQELKVQDQYKKRTEQQRYQQKTQQVNTNSIDAFVFLNCAPEDLDLVAEIASLLNVYGIDYVLPLHRSAEVTPSDIRQDIENNILNCDAVLILYQQTAPVWVRAQIAECRRLQRKRDTPLKIIAIFKDPSNPDLGFTLNNLHIYNCLPEQIKDYLPSFIEELA